MKPFALILLADIVVIGLLLGWLAWLWITF